MPFFLVKILTMLLQLYVFIVILDVVVSWLLIFNVINDRNEQARNLVRLLGRATEPVMGPVRKYVPPIAGIDLTPLIVIIGIGLIQSFLWSLVAF